jgi:hypothetical protein
MKMNKNIRKVVIFSTLGVLWLGSILFILAPEIGLTPPVIPKPDYSYALFTMIISGALLALYSFKTGISFIRT